MNNELISTAVMLSSKDQEAPLVRFDDGIIRLRIIPNRGGSYLSGEGWNYQHLYLVSDEEIKVGDWILHKSPEYEKVQTGWELHRYSNPHGSVATTDWRKKIIATTNKSLSLPLIPNSFIERWVRWQGDIAKVSVQTEIVDLPQENLPDQDWIPTRRLKLTPYPGNEVIILPIEDKTCSRKEMKDAVEAYREYVVRTGLLDAPSFQAWFDLNY